MHPTSYWFRTLSYRSPHRLTMADMTVEITYAENEYQMYRGNLALTVLRAWATAQIHRLAVCMPRRVRVRQQIHPLVLLN